MVVLSVTNCPQQLQGDLTKWCIEIDVGVYVGKISARVREKYGFACVIILKLEKQSWFILPIPNRDLPF